MYDLTNEYSFKSLRIWNKLIEENAQTNVCKVLVGNKADKPDRVITEEEGIKLGEDFNMKFFESSAKVNLNVDEVFDYLAREILKVQKGTNIQKSLKIKDKKTKKNSENKDIKSQKNSDKKEIDYNKNVNLKLYKFLTY